MGTVADMVIHPWGAILVGIAAGLVSVFGFKCANVSTYIITRAVMYLLLLFSSNYNCFFYYC